MSAEDPLILVVGDRADIGARSAALAAGRALGQDRVLYLTGPALAAVGWRHRVDADGAVNTTLRRVGGRQVTDSEVALVWFRETNWLAQRRRSTADTNYEIAEMQALLVSWLSSLGPRAVNRVDGGTPTGPSFSPRRWLHLAVRCGLPVAAAPSATSARMVPGWVGSPFDARLPLMPGAPTAADSTVLVTGDVATGSLAAIHGPACRRLAAEAGCGVLTVDFDHDGRVTAVSPIGVITGSGQIDAAARYLIDGWRTFAGEVAA